MSKYKYGTFNIIKILIKVVFFNIVAYILIWIVGDVYQAKSGMVCTLRGLWGSRIKSA